MKLGLSKWRGLRWRLTFSYAAVTVVTVLALEVAFLALVQSWMFGGSLDFALVLGSAVDGVAPEAAPYLEQTPPDTIGLQSWLVNRVRPTNLRLPFDVDLAAGPSTLLAVVGADG